MNTNIGISRVVVVSVTFNSSSYLEKMMAAISGQTYEVQQIIVVDNASIDKHIEVINELESRYPKLIIIHSEVNLGGAGGFQKGMQYVLDEHIEYDWIWLMDDDAYPMPTCLEELIRYKDLKNVGALAPVIYGVDKKEYQFYHNRIEDDLIKYHWDIYDYEKLGEITKMDSCAFVGVLVKKSIIDKVGIPDGDLFLEGDDREYTYRLSRISDLYLIKKAQMNHRDVFALPNMLNVLWKNYYLLRNKFLFLKKYSRSKLQYFFGCLKILRICLKMIAAVVIKKKYVGNRRKIISIYLDAIYDGLHGIAGKGVDPIVFQSELIVKK